jgi:deoxyribose-phosphate aldolase
MVKVRELAKMIDHSILHPTITDSMLEKECEVALKFGVASVCIKPYMVTKAAELLKGTDVAVGCVVGFPHGNSTSAVKVFEAIQACKDGAREIDMVINIGKTLSGDWSYVENEVRVITAMCHEHQALVKVIFETDYITKTEDKIRLCEICTRTYADFVKTSTGYGFVKLPDGNYNYQGATVSDIELMRKHSGQDVRIKAAGGVRTLDDLLKMREAGADRCGATATEAILTEALKQFGNG